VKDRGLHADGGLNLGHCSPKGDHFCGFREIVPESLIFALLEMED
jgi:hypothetical protein